MNPAKLIIDLGGRVRCMCTFGFSIELDCTDECHEMFTRGYAQEAIRCVLGNAIDLHTFDGVEVMGEPEINATIVNK